MVEKDPTCPTCESPLLGDAMRTGKCQCCGSPLLKQSQEVHEQAEHEARRSS